MANAVIEKAINDLIAKSKSFYRARDMQSLYDLYKDITNIKKMIGDVSDDSRAEYIVKIELAVQLYHYLLAAMYAFHETESVKGLLVEYKFSTKYEAVNAYARAAFNVTNLDSRDKKPVVCDEFLLQHIHDAGVNEAQQMVLLSFAQSDNPIKSDDIPKEGYSRPSTALIFSFKTAETIKYLFEDKGIKERFVKRKFLFRVYDEQMKNTNYKPESLYDAYINFIAGYFYENGCTELGIAIDLNKARF